MGLLRKKEKYEKGGIVRGTIQVAAGTAKYAAGTAKKEAGDYGTGTHLQRSGAKDIVKGTKKILGMKVKKD